MGSSKTEMVVAGTSFMHGVALDFRSADMGDSQFVEQQYLVVASLRIL